MKKLLALLLTLAMLLSMVGTMATAEAVKPTLSYPKMTASVDEEGLLVIGFDNDVKDYHINEIRIENDYGWSQTQELYPDDYDAEKKAYTRNIGKDWANAEVLTVNVNLNERKDGKVDDRQYWYENGKIGFVDVATGTYTEDDANRTATETVSVRQEYYDEWGDFSGYRTEGRTRIEKPVDGVWTSTTTSDYKNYDTDNKMNASGTRTETYTNQRSETDEKGQFVRTYTQDLTDNESWYRTFGKAETYPKWITSESKSGGTQKEQSTEYSWTDEVTGETEYWEEPGEQISSESHDEMTRYNKNGVKISLTKSSSSWDSKTNKSSSEWMMYDAYGNLLDGASESDIPAEYSEKDYQRGGLYTSLTYKFDTNEDGSRKNDSGYYWGVDSTTGSYERQYSNFVEKTATKYSSDEYKNVWKSEETVTKPNKAEYTNANGNKVTASLDNSYTTTEYAKDGSVKAAKTYSGTKTYSADDKGTVTTYTTKEYVGAISDGELKATTVTTYVSPDNGGHKNTTVKTDYTGAVIYSSEDSEVYTPATETAKETYVYTNVTTENGKKTRGTVSKTTYDYDGEGHSSYSSTTTNEDGKITQSVEKEWNKEDKKYVTTTSYNDKNGTLRGKQITKRNGNGSTEYSTIQKETMTDKDGKVLYAYTYTPSSSKNGETTPASATYTDADGKEIGYKKYNKNGIVTSSKIPEIIYGKTNLALNGWKEYTRTEETEEANGKKTTLIKYEDKTYDQAGNMIYHQIRGGKDRKTTTTYYSKYDANKQLQEIISNKDKNGYEVSSTETYNQNPGYVKSKVVTEPEDTVEKDSKEREIKRKDVTTTEYFDLAGNLDRSEVITVTTTTTWSEDGKSDSTKVKTTEWKNAAGATVVTKTENDYAKSGENRIEYKKADGTLIGYEKQTKNDDGSVVYETVDAEFNPYTGYVYSTTKETETKDKKGEQIKYTFEGPIPEEGAANAVITREKTETGNKDSEAWYYEQEDGTIKLGWDWNGVWNEDEASSTGTGHSYYYSGKVGRSWEETRKYDPAKDVWTVKEVNKDTNGNVAYTIEGTVAEIATTSARNWENNDFEYDTFEVKDLVYKDAKGNVIGYEKTDAKTGTVTSKVPYYSDDRADGRETRISISGKVAQGWKETVKDVWGNTLSSKTYNAKGQLMSESYNQADKSGSTSYWKWTANKSSATDTITVSGITKSTSSYYNEDGSLRKTVVSETGRASGTHVEVEKQTVTNGSGTVMYTYEQSKDLRTTVTNGVYKDAAGKEIGHYTADASTGVYSELIPTSGGRTGKILGFEETTKDKDGLVTRKTYDANMTLLSSSSIQKKSDKTEDNHSVTSYYKDGSDKAWKVVTEYEDGRIWAGGYTETAMYNKAGEKVASEISKNYSQGQVEYETKYYNQKGELVYSSLMINELNNKSDWDESHYWVYLDANGKEIARTQTADNGDYSSKTPMTTYANNITGYSEMVISDDGKVTITRRYDKDNNLIGETYNSESVVITDDQVTTTVSKKDGTIVNKTVVDRDEDMVQTRKSVKTYSRWDGKFQGEKISYPATDDYRWPAYRYIDANGNETYYGWAWSEDNYGMTEEYWVNGQMKQYSWSDNLWPREEGTFTSQYNADGSYYYWDETDGNGNSKTWYYTENGILVEYDEVNNGVRDITYYNKDGSVRGYDWGITTTYEWPTGWDEEEFGYDVNGYGLSNRDSVVWDATTALYDKHIEPDPDAAGNIETWKDYAGNVKVSKASGTTVTLTNNANGWHKAFGNEWYYVEGGQIATGWKQLDGTWYYFDKSGKMATGIFVDNKTTYAADADGAWVASGWNVDEYGNWQYIENGTVVTGWKQIGGKWYYFDDGWYIDTSYDSTAGWKQYTGGNMAIGAAKIWNDSWTDKITYFFNADGSWDTTPGWKTDGIDTFYFYKGGQRATGWKKIGKDWYYFNSNGVMRNGWVGGGNSWYYMDPATGKMVEDEWIQERFEDTWYYADKGGEMATGWREIDGDWYYFNSDGDMASQQWVKSGSDWYFMKKDGDMATGWAQDKDEKWYYMDEDGAMESSKWVGDDASGWYYVGSDGAMLTGTQTIDGRVNIFDENGLWIGYGD